MNTAKGGLTAADMSFDPEDLSKEAISKGYAHSSMRPSDRVQMEKESYVSFMKDLQADMLEDLPAENDQLLVAELMRISGEYVTRRESVMSVRSGVVSSQVAGRSNFNSRQASQRGSALDRAEQRFSAWQTAARTALAELVGVAQVRRDKAALGAEKFKKARAMADQIEAEEKAAERAKLRNLKIVNDPAAAVHMTKSEWAKTHRDFKSILPDCARTRRTRMVMRVGGLQPVFITDQKVVTAPD